MKKSEKLDIIYEDKNLLVVNKPAHLLTIATADEKINTLYHKAFEYIKKKNKNNKIFIVHRLDKDTSGIVLFAKSQELKEMLQNDWNNLAATREYIAVVEGKVDITPTSVYFYPESFAEGHEGDKKEMHVRHWELDSITEVYRRRYLLAPTGLEIVEKNKSYFWNFF